MIKRLTKEQVQKIKERKRVKLTFTQWLVHYSVVIFLLAIPVPIGLDLVEIHITNNYTGVRTTAELTITTIALLLPAILFAFIQHDKLNFRDIPLSCSDEQFAEAIARSKAKYQWHTVQETKNIFRAWRVADHGDSNELLTVINDKDRILINSITNPDSWHVIFPSGNRKNINDFLTNLIDILNDNEPATENKKPVNEWSIKNTLFRVFAYPFCLLLIVLGLAMIMEPARPKSAILGVLVIAITVFYFYTDIRVLINKKSAK